MVNTTVLWKVSSFLSIFTLLVVLTPFASATTLQDNFIWATSFDTADISSSTNQWDLVALTYDVDGNNVDTGQTGILGESYYFNGVNDYMYFPTQFDGDFELTTEAFSISAWIYPTTLTTNPTIYSISDAANDGLNFYVDTSGYLKLEMDAQDTYANASAISANEWTHVAVSVDRNGVTDGKAHLYVNGVEVSDYSSQATISSEAMSITSSSNEMAGRIRYDSAVGRLIGYMDSIIFWDAPINDTEVAIIYDGGQGRTYDQLVAFNYTPNYYTEVKSNFTSTGISGLNVTWSNGKSALTNGSGVAHCSDCIGSGSNLTFTVKDTDGKWFNISTTTGYENETITVYTYGEALHFTNATDVNGNDVTYPFNITINGTTKEITSLTEYFALDPENSYEIIFNKTGWFSKTYDRTSLASSVTSTTVTYLSNSIIKFVANTDGSELTPYCTINGSSLVAYNSYYYAIDDGTYILQCNEGETWPSFNETIYKNGTGTNNIQENIDTGSTYTTQSANTVAYGISFRPTIDITLESTSLLTTTDCTNISTYVYGDSQIEANTIESTSISGSSATFSNSIIYNASTLYAMVVHKDFGTSCTHKYDTSGISYPYSGDYASIEKGLRGTANYTDEIYHIDTLTVNAVTPPYEQNHTITVNLYTLIVDFLGTTATGQIHWPGDLPDGGKNFTNSSLIYATTEFCDGTNPCYVTVEFNIANNTELGKQVYQWYNEYDIVEDVDLYVIPDEGINSYIYFKTVGVANNPIENVKIQLYRINNSGSGDQNFNLIGQRFTQPDGTTTFYTGDSDYLQVVVTKDGYLPYEETFAADEFTNVTASAPYSINMLRATSNTIFDRTYGQVNKDFHNETELLAFYFFTDHENYFYWNTSYSPALKFGNLNDVGGNWTKLTENTHYNKSDFIVGIYNENQVLLRNLYFNFYEIEERDIFAELTNNTSQYKDTFLLFMVILMAIFAGSSLIVSRSDAPTGFHAFMVGIVIITFFDATFWPAALIVTLYYVGQKVFSTTEA